MKTISKNAVSILFFVLVMISFLPKVNGYQPNVDKLIFVKTDVKSFEGYYRWQNQKGMFVKISVSEGNIILKQLWDDKEIPLERKNDLEFANKEGFKVKFVKGKDGKINRLIALDKDVWDRVKEDVIKSKGD